MPFVKLDRFICNVRQISAKNIIVWNIICVSCKKTARAHTESNKSFYYLKSI